MKILNLLLFAVSITYLSCSSTWKTNLTKLSFSKFKTLKVGETSMQEVRFHFGAPNKIYHLGKDKQIVKKSEEVQWVYKNSKLYLHFESNILVSKSWSVDETEKISSVKELLNDFKADWKVIKEPMTNPHAGPTECYLEDLIGGKLVKVDGYKKVASEISIWVPAKNKKSIKEHLYRNVGKEFCIAGHCSKVTDPEAWKHNHCEWLVELVAKRR